MPQDPRMRRALSRWAPVRQMATWSRRQWKAAGWSYLVALLVMGVAGETLPGASAGRVVPVQWWNYVTLVLSPPLIALIVATFVPVGQSSWVRRRARAGVGVGGVAGTVAMACPACNPIAIPVFGAAGVLSFLAPYRGVIALASVAFLALTLALRLRATRACQLAPRPAGQGPGAGSAPRWRHRGR
jgi:hypothetical protein